MSDADARRWAEMAGSDTTTATSQPSAAADAGPAPQQQFQPPQGKKGKAKKEKRQKPPKVPSASRSRSSSDDVGLLDLGRETRSREQLMQAGAEDLMVALQGSYNLLHAEVPDSSSPDDAQRKIENQLERFDRDIDGDLPNHPIYNGDTLVYFQLRRHYGLVQPGNTQGSLGGLLRRSESIHRGIRGSEERGARRGF
jgi:hypothetical protein